MSLAAEAPARAIPWWLKRHETLLAIILVIALVGLGAANERFLTVDNLLNQGRLMTEIGLIALPMTFVIITGGIDLSVGAVVGLCAIMLGYSWKNFGFPLPVAIVFALAVGGVAGFVNGLVITRIKVPPLIMTIATLALYRGLAEGISQAHSVRGYPEWFYVLGQGDLFGVPTQLVVLVILMWLRGSRSTGRLSAAPSMRSAPTRRRRASPRCRSIGSSSSSTRCRAWPRGSRQSCWSPA